MSRHNQIMLVFILIFSTVGCDQSTKFLATKHLQTQPPASYVYDLFRFQYAENPGAMLSLGESLSRESRFIIFTLLVGLFLLAALLYVLFKHGQSDANITGLSLVVGGGVSNLIDRLTNNGLVVDFMNIGIGNIRTGIFNWADVVILFGIGILLIDSYHKTKKTSIT